MEKGMFNDISPTTFGLEKEIHFQLLNNGTMLPLLIINGTIINTNFPHIPLHYVSSSPNQKINSFKYVLHLEVGTQSF